MCDTAGLVFARVSRAQPRASTVVFSDKATLRRMNGHFYLMFRVAETRQNSRLVEAHGQCRALMGCSMRHRRPVPRSNGRLYATPQGQVEHLRRNLLFYGDTPQACGTPPLCAVICDTAVRCYAVRHDTDFLGTGKLTHQCQCLPPPVHWPLGHGTASPLKSPF